MAMLCMLTPFTELFDVACKKCELSAYSTCTCRVRLWFDRDHIVHYTETGSRSMWWASDK